MEEQDEELSYNKAKVYSITYHIVRKQKKPVLTALYRDYLRKLLTKEQFILILLLCETYRRNNSIEESVLYRFIDYYIRKNTQSFIHKLIFD